MELTIDTTREPSKAVQKPSTEKPTTKYAAKSSNPALITKENKPSVIILIGRVRINSTGRIRTFITPKTKAAIIATLRPSTAIPGTK